MRNEINRHLLPPVKEAEAGVGRLDGRAGFRLEFRGAFDPALRAGIEADFDRLLAAENARCCPQGLPVVLTLADEPLTPSPEEGYVLEVSPQGATVRANRAAGARYGLLTFCQLLDGNGGEGAPACRIRDWPSMALRVFHADLKVIPLNAAYLEHMVGVLADHKINMILMEYEDKFPFRNFPDIAVPSAFTPEALERFLAFCAARAVTILPLVQSYGHLEYILRKDRYRHLREDDRAMNEICGTNPEALALVTGMMEEVIAAHPGIRYFHIGGDEPFRVQFCPRCRRLIDEQGKGALYLQHIAKVLQFVQGKGLVPIMWDDMVATHPEISDKLPKPVVVNYWAYQPHANTSRIQLQRGVGQFDLATLRKKMTPEQLRKFEPYWQCDKYPEEALTFPLVAFYKDMGYPVFGGASARASAIGPLRLLELAENCHFFARRIRENKELGMVATSWAASGSLTPPNPHWDYFWYAQLAAAEHAWAGGVTPARAYTRKFLHRFHGIEDTKVARFFNLSVSEKKVRLDAGVRAMDGAQAKKNAPQFGFLRNLWQRHALDQAFARIAQEDMRKTARFPAEDMLPIDIRQAATRGFADGAGTPGWSNQAENDMHEFPTGPQVFGGIAFHILAPAENGNRAVICLKNYLHDPAPPAETAPIPVGARCRAIYTLHTYAWGHIGEGEAVGFYRLHYPGGASVDVPVRNGIEIGGWWNAEPAADALVVWKGLNAVTRPTNMPIGIYLYAVENPRPGETVEAVSIHSHERASLLCAGLTALKGGDSPPHETREWKLVRRRIARLQNKLDTAWAAERTHLAELVDAETLAVFEDLDYRRFRQNIAMVARAP